MAVFTPWARAGDGSMSRHRNPPSAGVIGAFPLVITMSARHRGPQAVTRVRLQAPGRIAVAVPGAVAPGAARRECAELASHEINFLISHQAKATCEQIHVVRIRRFVGV